ncbi:VWA domain-containing protein [Tropicibacter naphthalenivorans]|uniref:Mg-chelatase subunit ChlD n=1 Tax=Tropicibacter naphthalenivorans TaxID=441103 RepID=A0A0P1GN16_9RHOB|nr:VWA domain-containing protein [Tropicibacter naphthalenivorans]CUH75562.1 Mg-chelatase subunit ChlD [Tropicibacter naphthalenivorans]SMC43642.1 VWA domain containing CoxE-like protein [Tropicibacter naphthalenivorans]
MSSEASRRWRLMLGRYAQDKLGGLPGQDGARDEALDFLYRREYAARGIGGKEGSLDPTQLTALSWLNQSRALFPGDVFETLQGDALNRYGLTELLKDPDVLARIEPRQDLLPVLLGMHSRAPDQLKAQLRAVAQRVIDQIMERLRPKVTRAFSGQRNRFARSNVASAANFDWRATLRDNLSRYDPDRQRILAERLRFNARVKRRLPWTVVLCVDQSGSMSDSVIHAAVLAAILSGLPGITVKMVLFDTSVVDVTDRLTDPIDTLLSVQLGGGTDISRAMRYCETLIDNPTRTVLALVTDFFEGGSPAGVLASVARLAEAQVVQLGLPALDDTGRAWFDHDLAGKAADLGMQIGAMTPEHFAEWLAEAMA